MADPTLSRLFFDDAGIADSAFLTRTWHAPRKYPDPVLTAGAREECPVLYGSVLFREGRFHMWYMDWGRRIEPFGCYAVSDDGLHWEKPDLGFFDPADGYPPHAFLRSAHPDGLVDDLTVIEDPQDEAWPLKMLYYDNLKTYRDGGLFAARSRDGLRWEPMAPGRVLDWGDRFNALPARWNGAFVAFGRVRGPSPKGRSVWRAESDDLVHWRAPDLSLTRDAEDPPDREIYSLVPFGYGDLLLAGIERMAMAPDTLDTELAWSRDGGRTWNRPRERPAFLARGAAGAFDDRWINLSANAPIRRHGNLWFFYSGRTGAHHSPFPINHGGVGLALLRADGFVSMRAGEREGWLRTTPFAWPGGDLRVNADTRRDLDSHPRYAHGMLAAEALDAEGRPIEGFTRADAVPYTGNTIVEPDGRVALGWKDGRRLAALAGRTLQLRFFLRDAHLYSFSTG